MATAKRSTAKPYLKIEQLRRDTVESYIEQLISLLDQIDGDPDLEENGDLEPSLHGVVLHGAKGVECDLEGDTSDNEYSLGWANPMGLRVHVAEEAQELMARVDGFEGPVSLDFNGDGDHIGRKLLRDHVKDPHKLTKALQATRVSPACGRFA